LGQSSDCFLLKPLIACRFSGRIHSGLRIQVLEKLLIRAELGKGGIMKGQFSGKHVLISGGGRAIGFEIARQFGQQGAQITIFDNAEDLLNDAGAKLKEEEFEVHPYTVDVSRHSDVIEAVDAAEEIAPIDILINNAGIAFETPFLQITEAEWKKTIDVNLTGMFFVAQAVCKKMIPRKNVFIPCQRCGIIYHGTGFCD
jgi:NAD(P)-dependent dehydrogenase (short-subunit alcohol dehydrogenase family)